MKKYKLLRHSKCYINRVGDFVICLLDGNKKKGYEFAGSHAHPKVILGKFQLMSRIVANDGNWTEITPQQFNIVAAYHSYGGTVRFPANASVSRELIIRKFSPANS